jgi:hypothetical protein
MAVAMISLASSTLRSNSNIFLVSNVSPFKAAYGLTSTIGDHIPNASSVYETQTMIIPPGVKSFIMTIVDEAHEPPESNQKHISDHNSYFLPMNLTIPQNTSLSFLDADAPWDTPHPHSIAVIDSSSGQMVSTVYKLDYMSSSKSLVLPVGKYIVLDTKYPWMRATISVSPNQKTSANADLVVGAFYTTTNKVLNNKDNDGGVHPGWLGYYRNELPLNGFQILSEHNFHYAKCKYCPGGFWPDIKSADHTLLVYSTPQSLTQALSKLAKMIWNNVYI